MQKWTGIKSRKQKKVEAVALRDAKENEKAEAMAKMEAASKKIAEEWTAERDRYFQKYRNMVEGLQQEADNLKQDSDRLQRETEDLQRDSRENLNNLGGRGRERNEMGTSLRTDRKKFEEEKGGKAGK